MSNYGSLPMIPCSDFSPCCFRQLGKCTILRDTHFPDHKCHFRKADPLGQNCYDHPEKEEKVEEEVKEEKDVLRSALTIAGAFSQSKAKRMDCEYYGDKTRYCKCTSHTTCEGCRFYFPNSLSRQKILSEYIVRQNRFEKKPKQIKLIDPYCDERQLEDELDESLGY